MPALKYQDEEQNKRKTYICPDCNSEEVEKRNGEVYCLRCGLVLE